ncbi:MAG: hypothetical protein U5R30_06325 [Deltaproteobacteria bacterium]|nr:hypothetical protein [Deltaproteobacteria bacterium]
MTTFRPKTPTQPEIEPWAVRSPVDRRNRTIDRRQPQSFSSGRVFTGRDRRKENDRRYPTERREGWLRINRWQSVSVFDK